MTKDVSEALSLASLAPTQPVIERRQQLTNAATAAGIFVERVRGGGYVFKKVDQPAAGLGDRQIHGRRSSLPAAEDWMAGFSACATSWEEVGRRAVTMWEEIDRMYTEVRS